MKAIYINLDPYLQAVADWLNAGKPGDAPTFDPLPLSVTIPLGETACIYCPSTGKAEDDPADYADSVTIDGQTFYFWANEVEIPAAAIAVKVVPGLSALAPSAKYYVVAVTGDTTAKFKIGGGEIDEPIPVTFTVLVRRETASGPVDLVDFTPPAAAPSAADIKSALVEAGSGALEGVDIAGVVLGKGGSITCINLDDVEVAVAFSTVSEGMSVTNGLVTAEGTSN